MQRQCYYYRATVQNNILWLAMSIGSEVTLKVMWSKTSESYQRPDAPTGHGAWCSSIGNGNCGATIDLRER